MNGPGETGVVRIISPVNVWPPSNNTRSPRLNLYPFTLAEFCHARAGSRPLLAFEPWG